MAEGKTSHHGRQVGAYITRVLSGMAQGLFASLIIGLIIKQIGHYSGWLLLEQIGLVAQYLTGPAIGVGVALAVKAPMLGVLCSAVAGAVGAGTFVLGEGPSLIKVVLGEPFGAMLASLVGAEISKKVVGKTGVDIIVVPLATILGGSLVVISLLHQCRLDDILGSFHQSVDHPLSTSHGNTGFCGGRDGADTSDQQCSHLHQPWYRWSCSRGCCGWLQLSDDWIRCKLL